MDDGSRSGPGRPDRPRADDAVGGPGLPGTGHAARRSGDDGAVPADTAGAGDAAGQLDWPGTADAADGGDAADESVRRGAADKSVRRGAAVRAGPARRGRGAGRPGAARAASSSEVGRPDQPNEPGEAREGGEQLPLLPGFREMALRRMAQERRRLVTDLTAERQAARLSQTEVAARMGTSQSAVARLESGEADARASTLERYAAAIGCQITWRLQAGAPRPRREEAQGDDPAGN